MLQDGGRGASRIEIVRASRRGRPPGGGDADQVRTGKTVQAGVISEGSRVPLDLPPVCGLVNAPGALRSMYFCRVAASRNYAGGIVSAWTAAAVPRGDAPGDA